MSLSVRRCECTCHKNSMTSDFSLNAVLSDCVQKFITNIYLTVINCDFVVSHYYNLKITVTKIYTILITFTLQHLLSILETLVSLLALYKCNWNFESCNYRVTLVSILQRGVTCALLFVIKRPVFNCPFCIFYPAGVRGLLYILLYCRLNAVWSLP